LKKSPTGPAFTKDPLNNKNPITSNNKAFTFIPDQLKESSRLFTLDP